MLAITRLRALPKDTFKGVDLRRPTAQIEDVECPRRKHLLFDFPSLLQAYEQNIIDHLTDKLNCNKILIAELVLHQLDVENKECSRRDRSSGEISTESIRLRDFIKFLLERKSEEYMMFQRKGSQEDVSFIERHKLIGKNCDSKLRLLSYALYIKGEGHPVIFITSDDDLFNEARKNDIETRTVESLKAVGA
uniref:Uncharacterized protein TCIL3000_11_3240 n=1 Tax=Trypanosoma congolense (strain IL3000) TaxID=1068625 RepID=G0UZV7_TRYCI|nr:unnamed protein product [Trypanosoma congolense IL3000]